MKSRQSNSVEDSFIRKMRENLHDPFWIFYLFFVFIALCVVFGSCTTVKYIPVETETHINDSTRWIDSVRTREIINVRDSIIYHDSVVQVVDEQGNLLRSEYYRTKEVNRNLEKEVSQLKDQLRKEKSKEIETKEIPVVVEKELTTWQKIKLKTGEIMMVILGILLILGLFKLKKKVF